MDGKDGGTDLVSDKSYCLIISIHSRRLGELYAARYAMRSDLKLVIDSPAREDEPSGNLGYSGLNQILKIYGNERERWFDKTADRTSVVVKEGDGRCCC